MFKRCSLVLKFCLFWFEKKHFPHVVSTSLAACNRTLNKTNVREQQRHAALQTWRWHMTLKKSQRHVGMFAKGNKETNNVLCGWMDCMITDPHKQAPSILTRFWSDSLKMITSWNTLQSSIWWLWLINFKRHRFVGGAESLKVAVM